MSLKTDKERYEEIKDKAVVVSDGAGYNHRKYLVVSNPENLEPRDLALIATKGNLPFGFRVEGNTIIVYED